MAADGSIIIDTRIQTEGLSKGLNTIKAGMTRITAQVSKMGETAKNSFQRQIATVDSLYQSYEKQERKVAELKSKLDELGKSKIETEGYKLISDQIKALETDFEKVDLNSVNGSTWDSRLILDLLRIWISSWIKYGWIWKNCRTNRKRCRYPVAHT